MPKNGQDDASKQLANYDRLVTQLATCVKVDDAKAIRDKAEALRIYAVQAKDPKLETYAGQIKFRACRRIGEIALTLEKGPPGPRKIGVPGDTQHKTYKIETLKKAGLSRFTVNKYEQLAAIPQQRFDAYLKKRFEDRVKELEKFEKDKDKPRQRDKKTGKLIPLKRPEVVTCKEFVKGVRAEFRKEKKETEKKTAARKAAKMAPPGDDQGVFHGDFREIAKTLTDNSIPLIFADPPYDRESLPLYGDLAQVAARILEPGGSLIVYSAQYQIHEILNLITPHLRLWWTLCCLHTGRSARMTEYGVVVHWKPMLWFVKGTRGDKHTLVDDLVTSREEKDRHDWQQSEIEAAYYIEKLTLPGDLVFDPFCGGSTTAAAAKRLSRRWITCDINKDTVHLARERVRNVAVQQPK